MKLNSVTKLISLIIMCIVCTVCVAGILFWIVQKFKLHVPTQSVININKDTLSFRPTATLPHYYEWGPNQTITFENHWLPHSFKLVTNSDGLIEDKEYPKTPPDGTYRIIALGDSFTEGVFVEKSDSYPKKLEKILNERLQCKQYNAYEVLNFGVSGYDIEYAAERFVTKGILYKPDLTLWLLKEDDFNEIAEMDRQQTEALLDKLVANNTMSAEDRKNQGIWIKYYNIIRDKLLQTINQKYYFDLQTHAIGRAAQATNGKIILFTFDFTKSIYKKRMQYWTTIYPRISYTDIVRDIYQLRETNEPYDGHPNKDGYASIADDMYTYLYENVFKNIGCSSSL